MRFAPGASARRQCTELKLATPPSNRVCHCNQKVTARLPQKEGSRAWSYFINRRTGIRLDPDQNSKRMTMVMIRAPIWGPVGRPKLTLPMVPTTPPKLVRLSRLNAFA